MRNSSEPQSGSDAQPQCEGGMHPQVDGYLAQGRSQLEYAVSSLLAGGMDRAEVERFTEHHLQGRFSEAALMQHLVELGMEATSARRYVPQQHAIDRGRELPDDTVARALFADEQRTAQGLLAADKDSESGHVLSARLPDDSPNTVQHALRKIVAFNPTVTSEAQAIVSKVADQLRESSVPAPSRIESIPA